jgi:SAM-dependent methyltransferase
MNALQNLRRQGEGDKPIGRSLVNLIDSWETQSQDWIEWARLPGFDSYWRYHRDQFLQLLPPPNRRTVDVGCGEGRLTRHLKELGHQIVGVDASPSMVAAARELDPSMDIRLADATALPLDDASADLVVAFMSLHDIDAMPLAVHEMARILEPSGKICLAIVHPINSAGDFEHRAADSPFIIKGDYLRSFRYEDTVERDGLTMTFHSQHRPIAAYFSALEEAGFLIEALRETGIPEHAIVSEVSRRWQRLPLFLHVRARRP